MKLIVRALAQTEKTGGLFSAAAKPSLWKRFVQGFHAKGLESLPREVQEGLKREAVQQSGGPLSLAAWGPEELAKKILGKERVDRVMWEGVSKPAHSANVILGKGGQKIPFMKGLFTEKKKLPIGPEGKNLYKEVSYPSATAPLTKGLAIATPIVMGVQLDKLLQKRRKNNEADI
jgi:hypothetical protein